MGKTESYVHQSKYLLLWLLFADILQKSMNLTSTKEGGKGDECQKTKESRAREQRKKASERLMAEREVEPPAG